MRLRLPRISSCLILSTGLLIASNAHALDTFMVGPRAVGMAGANVASVNNTTAQYYNPAAFAFFGHEAEEAAEESEETATDNNNLARKKWGVDLDFGAGYRQHNNFGEYIDDLENIDLDLLSTTGVEDSSDLADIIAIANSLQGLDAPGNGITATVNSGLGIRFHNYGIGFREFAQVSGQVLDVDTANLGIEVDTTIAGDIGTVTMPAAYDTATYDFQVFTTDQVNTLLATLGGDTAENREAVKRLDYTAYSEGFATSDVAGLVEVLDTTLNQSGTGSIDDNTTTVRLAGVGFVEVPVSYGHIINDWLAVGANLKLMRGRVYGNQVAVFGENSGDIIDQTDDFYEETTTFGVDVGVMARFEKMQAGAVIRNLNGPTFDAPTIVVNGQTITFSDVKLDPQLAVGAAYIPFETLTIEIDFDITKNETIIPDYDTQNLSLGLEWDAFRFVALRAGVYKNTAESDIGWVYTAGLGINMWATRLDLAGVFSEDSQQFDNEDIPEEVKVALQLSVDF